MINIHSKRKIDVEDVRPARQYATRKDTQGMEMMINAAMRRAMKREQRDRR